MWRCRSRVALQSGFQRRFGPASKSCTRHKDALEGANYLLVFRSYGSAKRSCTLCCVLLSPSPHQPSNTRCSPCRAGNRGDTAAAVLPDKEKLKGAEEELSAAERRASSSKASTSYTPAASASHRVSNKAANGTSSSKATASNAVGSHDAQGNQSSHGMGKPPASASRRPPQQPPPPAKTVRMVRPPTRLTNSTNSPASGTRQQRQFGLDDDDEGLPRRTVRIIKPPGGLRGALAPYCQRCGNQGFVGSGMAIAPCPNCQPAFERQDPPDFQSLNRPNKFEELDEILEAQALPTRRGRRARKQPMTAEHRAKIRAALTGQKRGPASEEHKRKIARSMRRLMASKEQRAKISAAALGTAKHCSHCGELGHNRRACPQLRVGASEAGRRCSHCGRAGHYAPACPDLHLPPAAAGRQQRRARQKRERSQAAAVRNAAASPTQTTPPNSPAVDGQTAALRSTATATAAADTQAAQLRTPTSPSPTADGLAGGAKAARLCSHCGQPGHYVRTCPNLALPPVASKRQDLARTKRLQVKAKLQQARGQTFAAAAAAAEVVPGQQLPAQYQQDGAVTSSVPLREVMQHQTTSADAGVGEYGEAKDGEQQRREGEEEAGRLPSVMPVPLSVEEEIKQVVETVLAAWRSGVRRQKLELMLPLSQAGSDVDGWPGGIRQQFRLALPMVEAILKQLKTHDGLQGPVSADFLDESDCVGAWQSDRLACVLFPTGNTLTQLRHIDASRGDRLLLVVNPQWQPEGQIISDFGLGRTRREAEEFVRWFEDVYYLKRIKVLGDDARVLRCYPGKWQVHYMQSKHQPRLVALADELPSYQDLLKMLRHIDSRQLGPRSWVDRIPYVFQRDDKLFQVQQRLNGLGSLVSASRSDETGTSSSESDGEGAGLEPPPGGAALAVDDGTRPDRFQDIDIITGQPVRDLKLEPIMAIARWRRAIFGSQASDDQSS